MMTNEECIRAELAASSQNHLLEGDDALVTHGGLDSDKDVLLARVLERLTELLAELALGELQVLTGLTVVQENRAVAVGGDVEQLVLEALHDGDLHVVSRGADILVLLASEDVKADKVDLRVTVLAGLRGRHVDNLAREALQNDEAVLAERRALLRESLGTDLLGRLEIVVGLCHLGRSNKQTQLKQGGKTQEKIEKEKKKTEIEKSLKE